MLEAIRDAILRRFKGVEFLVLASLFLSGCAHYDVGIQFDSQTQGVIVQHVLLGERLATSSGPSVQQWLTQLEQQARQLGAQVRHPSERELAIILPFNNGTDLSRKFNNFWGAGRYCQPGSNVGASRHSFPFKRQATELAPRFEQPPDIRLGPARRWLPGQSQ